jgi:hypothetical protein
MSMLRISRESALLCSLVAMAASFLTFNMLTGGQGGVVGRRSGNHGPSNQEQSAQAI